MADFYDANKNPTPILKWWYECGCQPHADLKRWTYTVPAGRKALVTHMHNRIQRGTPASSASRALADIHVVRAGGADTIQLMAGLRTNGVGDLDSSVAGGILLFAGDELYGATEDLSTGGTTDPLLSAHIVEFDA